MKVLGGIALALWFIFLCFDVAMVLFIVYAIAHYLLTH